MHANAVCESLPYSLPETVWDGLSDAQRCANPHGLNAIVWHVWHLACTEDEGLSLVARLPRLIDQDGWHGKLGVERRDAHGMTREESHALSATIDPTAVWDHRNAVGLRTREVLGKRDPEHWQDALTADDITSAVENGVYTQAGAESVSGFLVGTPRIKLLEWWAHAHSLIHLGQATTIRHMTLALEQ